MAISHPSSAPLFPSLTVETGTDPILHRGGASQWLGESANHHDGELNFSPNGNRVQDGSLSLINDSNAPFGTPIKAKPLGRQTL